jgi:capsular polysaccharide transport system permease protein
MSDTSTNRTIDGPEDAHKGGQQQMSALWQRIRALFPKRRSVQSELLPQDQASTNRKLPALARIQSVADAQQAVSTVDGAPSKVKRWVLLSFALLVVLPWAIYSSYLFFIASPQYVAEMKLVVRSADKNDALKEGLSIVQKFISKGSSSTSQDGQIVVTYVKSRSIVEDIGGKIFLSKLFSDSKIDYFSRLDANEPYEEIIDYWRKYVTASIDTISNIITIRVRAFSPEDASMVASAIIRKSETLINSISRRSRELSLSRAEEEVHRSADHLAEERRNLQEFRDRSGTIDPVLDAQQTGKLILALTMQRIELEAQISTTSGTIDSSSVIARQRRAQLESINKKLDELRQSLTNSESANAISEKLREFEQLKLRVMFAEKIHEISQKNYETARIELAKQALFLDTVTPPLKPEYPLYPKAFLYSLLFFFVASMFYGVILLLAASIYDHAE